MLAGIDLHTGTRVAIATSVPSTQTAVARSTRAGSVRIDHPNVVRTLDCGWSDGEMCVVMERVEGPTLKQALSDHREPSVSEAVAIADALEAGLAALHQQKIIHRDLKPANIILSSSGPVIIDFGLVRRIGEETVTGENKAVGSLAYMAPEQLTQPDRVSTAADLYSLGAVLFEMLTGRPPHDHADEDELARAIVHDEPARPSSLVASVPTDIDERCSRLLSKVAADRARLSCFRCLACGKRLATSCSTCPGCSLAFPPNQSRLMFTQGSAAGQTFLIPMATFVTGRLQIAPEDRSMSRAQMAVTCTGSVSVRDLGGPNPTRLADCPLSFDSFLTPGDRLAVGGTTGIFMTN